MKNKKVRCIYELKYLYKNLIRHRSFNSIETMDNFINSLVNCKIISFRKIGRRKGEYNKKYW